MQERGGGGVIDSIFEIICENKGSGKPENRPLQIGGVPRLVQTG